jgi:cell wall-associated NlpC family hydrolase
MDLAIIVAGHGFDPARRVFDHRGVMSVLLLAAWIALSPAQTPAHAIPTAATASIRREAVILSPVENMYSGPDTAKDVVSQALLGQVVGILEEKDGFARIETPDRYSGWIPMAALFPYADRAAQRYARRGAVAEVIALMANLYREPSVTTARPKAQAPLGTRLEVNPAAVIPEGTANRWIGVRLPNGEGAYVQRGDVRLGDAAAREPGSGEDLVATARRFLGVPYLWGGMSFHGVDCSGLVSRVYAANGIELLRDADIQFTDPRGRAIERAALQPGDLLFFGNKSISHVGLHVADGRFISATTYQTPVVREDSLDDPYWAAIYRGARRMPADVSLTRSP